MWRGTEGGREREIWLFMWRGTEGGREREIWLFIWRGTEGGRERYGYLCGEGRREREREMAIYVEEGVILQESDANVKKSNRKLKIVFLRK